MIEGTHLHWYYEPLRQATVIQIRNEYTYVETYWTDEMAARTRRNDMVEAKRMLLLGLCQLWYERTDEELIPVYNGEGVEWSLEEVKHG